MTLGVYTAKAAGAEGANEYRLGSVDLPGSEAAQ